MPLLWFFLLAQDSEGTCIACQLNGFAASSCEHRLPTQLSQTKALRVRDLGNSIRRRHQLLDGPRQFKQTTLSHSHPGKTLDQVINVDHRQGTF